MRQASSPAIPNHERDGGKEHKEENSLRSAKPLKVLFFDLKDPLDSSNWSGTPAQIFRCLEEAGATVIPIGSHYLFHRKSINWIIFRYYRYVKKLFYHN